MSKGIVVDHRESRVRYAISEDNFNEKVHKKIRDLKPGESVLGYRPRRIERLGEAETSEEPSAGTGTPGKAAKSESDASEALSESAGSSTAKASTAKATQTEGSASAGTQG